MEQNLAMLMADLSGYTALTETHGAVSAADLIDKYISIVEKCLVGKSRLQERTGDEVFIISPDADDLLATAIMIMKQSHAKENFLQVHGGIHFGKVLNRHGSYYGSPINITARITARARPGTIWLSYDFLEAVKNPSVCTIEPAGKHQFKNVSEGKELFELHIHNDEPYVIDPVCRMLILDKRIATKHPESDIYFCSSDCFNHYEKKLSDGYTSE